VFFEPNNENVGESEFSHHAYQLLSIYNSRRLVESCSDCLTDQSTRRPRDCHTFLLDVHQTSFSIGCGYAFLQKFFLGVPVCMSWHRPLCSACYVDNSSQPQFCPVEQSQSEGEIFDELDAPSRVSRNFNVATSGLRHCHRLSIELHVVHLIMSNTRAGTFFSERTQVWILGRLALGWVVSHTT
jgi:hypothetical protein